MALYERKEKGSDKTLYEEKAFHNIIMFFPCSMWQICKRGPQDGCGILWTDQVKLYNTNKNMEEVRNSSTECITKENTISID